MPDLDVRLDSPLPRHVGVGRGTALFVCGSCFSPQGPIAELEFTLDGSTQPVDEHGMPRLDLFEAVSGTEEDPLGNSYRSGFWGTVRVPPAPTGAVRSLGLRARLADGSAATAELAALEPAEGPKPVAAQAQIAICMATHEPPPALLTRQIESIKGQSHSDWVCVISDDCSSPARFAELEAAVAGDERFVVSRSPSRLGFYANFERALAMAPLECEFVAPADQDDVWHEDKLATLAAEIGAARLVYSDARLVSTRGEVLADTYWSVRQTNHDDIEALLMANSVTGAASLFRREVLDDALPFPPAQFAHFHDHWLALTALALGEIRFVDRPLYDYTQHGGAVLGHAAANRTTRLGDRFAKLGEDPRERVRRWRMHFYIDNCRLRQFTDVLDMRVGDRMQPRRRRALRRLTAADSSLLALGRLGLRAVCELRGGSRTLGAEVGLFFAYLWRRLVVLSAGRSPRPRRWLRLDSVPPPNLAPRPGRRVPQAGAPRSMAEKIAPLELAVRDDAPERVNLLLPTIELKHLFGGYIAKFNLARRLAERGRQVRIVTVDPVGPLPRDWKSTVESYAGLNGLFDSVEVAFGRESDGLECSRDDRFIATTWWTAHAAEAARRALGGPPFLYLIQEYEPFTFPMGSWAALAEESYRFEHTALYSTELLAEFFQGRGIAAGQSASFRNAITATHPAAGLAEREPRRLLFYARPEEHAARNMFELGLLAIDRALERGAFAGWELNGIGTVEGSRRIALGGGAALQMIPRAAQDDYAATLAEHDVGLALMHTPHPSLVPIEMASAGMLAVTNSFENKTAQKLAAISPNLIAAEPGIESIAAALCEAGGAAGDAERRRAGAQVDWPSSWDEALGDGLLKRVEELLGG